jgi:hypothetical protein
MLFPLFQVSDTDRFDLGVLLFAFFMLLFVMAIRFQHPELLWEDKYPDLFAKHFISNVVRQVVIWGLSALFLFGGERGFHFLFGGTPISLETLWARRPDWIMAGMFLLLVAWLSDRDQGAAQYDLGFIYMGTWRGNPDHAMAAHWYRMAAAKGNESAQVALADLLNSENPKGKLLPEGELLPDYKEALRWYRRVANQTREAQFLRRMFNSGEGHVGKAEDGIGKMYAKGQGVARDYVEAVRWWRKAGEHGEDHAYRRIGELYAEGAEGVPQNYPEAYVWLYIAVRANDDLFEWSKKNAIEMRNEIAKHLTPQEFLEAQARAEQWLSDHPAKKR